MQGTLADRFLRHAETFLKKTAVEHGFGLSLRGTHTTERYGQAEAFTIFGWCGETSFAAVFGLPEEWKPIGRGYLLWFTAPGATDLDLRRLPQPVGEQILTAPEDLERFIMRGVRWLQSHPYAEVKASFYADCIESGGGPRGSS